MSGGGQVRYVSNLADQLVRQGHHVAIGCKPGSTLVGHGRRIGAAVYDRFLFRGGLRIGAWLRDLQTMLRLIRNQTPDVLHVNGSQDHWIAAVANRILGFPVPVVRTRHNTYPVANSCPNRMLNRRWTTFQIVVCDAVRQTLADHPAFDSARMRSVHNGVDAALFRPDSETCILARREFGYGPENVVCGIVARLVPAKGHEFLFRAARLLIDDFPQLRILVLGQGEREAELKRLADSLGLTEIVRFAGYREDMPYCVQALDIGVQPSIDCDTSSFSLKEQMAAEIAVVASDYGGLPEIITDGVEGFIVPAGEVEPLAKALQNLIADKALRTRMGQAGRTRVLNEFTVELFAERTLEAYREAIALHHRARGIAGNGVR